MADEVTISGVQRELVYRRRARQLDPCQVGEQLLDRISLTQLPSHVLTQGRSKGQGAEYDHYYGREDEDAGGKWGERKRGKLGGGGEGGVKGRGERGEGEGEERGKEGKGGKEGRGERRKGGERGKEGRGRGRKSGRRREGVKKEEEGRRKGGGERGEEGGGGERARRRKEGKGRGKEKGGWGRRKERRGGQGGEGKGERRYKLTETPAIWCTSCTSFSTSHISCDRRQRRLQRNHK